MTNYRDPTPVDPNQDYQIEELARFIREKMFGKDTREAMALALEKAGELAEWSTEVARQLIEGGFDEGALNTEIERKLNELESQYAPDLNSLKTEIGSARGNEATLGDNLNSIKTDLEQIEQNKASKTEVDKLRVNVLSKKYTQKRTATFNPVIVAYGDSNTRYYEGDRGSDGSVSLAYSTIVDRMTMSYPNLYESVVINAGYSSRTIQYGLDNYLANIINNNANIAIIGFGTNDIKRQESSLEDYINKMEQMIDRLLSDEVIPIVLGIPWYDNMYSPGTESRIPVWNKALMELCIEKNVEFVDVYRMFPGNMGDVWFNEESTPKRHYSIHAQKVLGEEINKRILKLNTTPTVENEYSQELFDTNNIQWLNHISSKILFRTYVIGSDSIDCLVIPEGESISFNVQGRSVIGFYPREQATVNVDKIGDIKISDDTSDGLYYPLLKVSDSESIVNQKVRAFTEVTVTAVSGDAYIRFIGSEYLPRNYGRGFNIIEKGGNSDGSYEIYADGTAKAWGIRDIPDVTANIDIGGLKRNSGNYGITPPIEFTSYDYANYHIVHAPVGGFVINASVDNPRNFRLVFEESLNSAPVRVAWEIKGKV